MQLVRLKRQLANIEAILDNHLYDSGVVFTEAELDILVRSVDEAIDAVDEMTLSHRAIVEALNRL